MKKRTGFTLIELLVVIAIIALLLSIVMPALKMVKKQAQAVICRSNLKQWGLIFRLYAEDNEDRFPQSVQDPQDLGALSYQEAYWMQATIKYYEDYKIRFCPTAKVDKDNDATVYDSEDYGDAYEHWGPIAAASSGTWWDNFPSGSYGINEWCASPPDSVNEYWGFPTSEAWKTITSVGANKIPMFLDCRFVDGYPMEMDSPPQFPEDHNGWGTNAMKQFCIDRHDGTINGVFVDLSAQSIGLKQLWTLKWHRNYNTSGPWTVAGGVSPNNWPEWMRGFKDY